VNCEDWSDKKKKKKKIIKCSVSVPNETFSWLFYFFGKINLGPLFFYSRCAVVLNYSTKVGSIL